jgi:hypothetical protein
VTGFQADYRPAWGGGSCAACDGALALDALKGDDGRWYCCPACAQGLPPEAYRPAAVPEPALYNRPRRFFRKRRPKELRGSAGGR